MNLIEVKRRTRTASRGYSILKRKREALVLEFMKLLKQSGGGRDYLYEVMQRAYKTMATSSTYVGNFELEVTAQHVREAGLVGMSVKNIMGVRIPETIREEKKNEIDFSLISTSIATEDIGDAFSAAIDAIIDVAQREQGLKRLVVEIEKTKRRVNALDNVIIPNFKSQSKYIAMRLEEIDRDMFSALKHVKKKLSKGA
jgi:V/A-type H+-transporting ATPase subunit D